MATNTGRTIASTYKNLLNIDNDNSGVDGTVRTVQDGEGTASALQLSQSTVNINGTFQINGATLTSDVSALNAITDITSKTGLLAVSGSDVQGRTLTAGTGMSITNGDGTAGNPTFSLATVSSTPAVYGPASLITVNSVGQVTSISTETSVSIAEIKGSAFTAETINASSNVSITGELRAGATSVSTLTATAVSATRIDAVSVSVDSLTANNLTIQGFQTSLSNFTVNNIAILSTTNITGPVSAESAVFTGAVSAGTFAATTAILVGGENVATSTGLAAVSATMATSIANVSAALESRVAAVSALTSVNLESTTSITSRITALSATMATSIANVSGALESRIAAVSALTSVNLESTTSITSRITALSATMATSIANVSSALESRVAAVSALTSVNLESTTSITSRITALSATMATSIANVSSALESRIAAVSALTSVNLESTTSITSRITALSATVATSIANVSSTMATSIANVSSTMATSIANHLPLAGGTITGTVSAQEVIVSSLGINTSTTGKRLKINGAAVAELASLTDGTSIAVNFNTAQNFVVQLKGNRTFENPSNCVAGQTGSIFIVQDGTGGRTGSFGSNWKFNGGTAPTLSTGVSAVDRLDYIVYTSTAVHAIATLDLQ